MGMMSWGLLARLPCQAGWAAPRPCCTDVPTELGEEPGAPPVPLPGAWQVLTNTLFMLTQLLKTPPP